MTASPHSRIPARTAERPAPPRAALRYALVVAAGLVLLLVLLAGCGAAPLPPAAPSTIAPTTPAPAPPPTTTTTTTTTTTAPPTSTSGTEPTTQGRGGEAATPAPQARAPQAAPKRAGGTPIWPASDAASARRLQDQVDSGGEPWLLDPSEVAVSYAGSELGYRNPGVFTLGPGRVDVQDGKSPAKATITLGQTVRRGDGGIWLVTGVQRR